MKSLVTVVFMIHDVANRLHKLNRIRCISATCRTGERNRGATRLYTSDDRKTKAHRSLEAAVLLWDLGFESVTSLVGGIERWASQRFTVMGRSQYDPVAANESDSDRSLNRRVEIIITPEKAIKN